MARKKVTPGLLDKDWANNLTPELYGKNFNDECRTIGKT
jgi:hypothetical protein